MCCTFFPPNKYFTCFTTFNVYGGGGLVTKSCPTLVTPWTVACQAPPSMGFSRQEYWGGLPYPFPGDPPDLEIELWSPALQADSSPTELSGKPIQSLWEFFSENPKGQGLVTDLWSSGQDSALTAASQPHSLAGN